MTPREAHHLIATLLHDLADCIEAGKTEFPFPRTEKEQKMDDRLERIADAMRERAHKHVNLTEEE